MANPIFKILNGNNSMPMAYNSFKNMVAQFQQFKETFQGDPRQEIEKLLQSGRMSQQQLNQLQEMAKQFQQLIK